MRRTLRELRLQLGLSQSAFAGLTGISRATLVLWEQGGKADPLVLARFSRKLEALLEERAVQMDGWQLELPRAYRRPTKHGATP